MHSLLPQTLVSTCFLENKYMLRLLKHNLTKNKQPPSLKD